jgi:putative phosphoribosyl transferase
VFPLARPRWPGGSPTERLTRVDDAAPWRRRSVTFRDRADAGRILAAQLVHLRSAHPVVLGLPRGGVPVAAEVARALGAPLDVALVRKLGVPFQPELAMGAIGEGGVRVVNDEVRRAAGVTESDLAAVEARERVELERRAERFRDGRPPLPLKGRTVVVVDDGIATGSTARAACEIARARGAAHVVLATPVAPRASLAQLAKVADDVVCVEAPEHFFAIGQWYDDFAQTSDAEVVALLGAAGRDPVADAVPLGEDSPIAVGPVVITGQLVVPERPIGTVVFAHGSGSSRHSPRNRMVAERLQDAAIATLLVDLLTPDEARDRAFVFDIELLARRLEGATAWVRRVPGVAGLPVGYFGASTGAAAALNAAAAAGPAIAAVVSRGGRPDLAEEHLGAVTAPTLLVVGGLDTEVLELNRRALERLGCEKHLTVVPGATHLFEEPGALESVAELARDWFERHLRPRDLGP